MPRATFKRLLAVSLLSGGLNACDMPTEPAGIHQELLTHMGESMQRQGDDDGAADFYQRALQHKPDDIDALRHLGGLLEKHGNVEAAEHYYADALRIEPDDEGTLRAEGRVLIRMGRPADARDVFQRAVESDGHDLGARNGLGIALDYLGQHEEAQKAYRDALNHAPDDLTTINNLAHSYILSRHMDQAIALLEPHAKDHGATPALRQNLAEAYGLSGMDADAERVARMDLKPQEVKRNLAFYKAQRAKLALEPKLAADLGAYPTKEMAEAQADNLKEMLQDSGITLAINPEVQSIGGTPSFVLQATGFKDVGALNDFCQNIAKNGVTCRTVKGR